MNKVTNIGHLVTIRNTLTENIEFIFLYITDDDPPDAYKKVIKGIRSLRLPMRLNQMTKIQADPVTDLSRIEQEYPETSGCKIHKLPVTSLFDIKTDTFKENLFLCGVINVTEKMGSPFPANCLPAVATGSDFFNREDLIKKIWKYVEKGQNVLICGPRRYGKTSIMRGIKDRAIERGFSPVMIDLESVFTPEEFIATIWVEVEWPFIKETEKNKKKSELEDGLRDRWFEKGKEIFKRISQKNENLLFLLDECPYMLDSFLGRYDADREEMDAKFRKKTNRFIRWFREQRDLTRNCCSFVLTGSVNLKPYLRDITLDKNSFLDCTEVRLTFFDSKTTRAYIESLLLGQEIFLPDEVIHELVRLTTPGIPYFIQIVMNQVLSLYRNNPRFSVEDLRKTYQENIIGPESRRLFDTFERHFKRYGRRKPGATAILRELSNAGDEGVAKGELEKIYNISSDITDKHKFDIILSYLEYDFYIERIKGTDRYRFASPMLRDYWQKNQR